MDLSRASELVVEWENEAGASLENPTYARTILKRALVSLVPDDAPASVLIDDDAAPQVAALVDGRLLLLQASAPGLDGADAVAECRTLLVNDSTKIAVTLRTVPTVEDGMVARRHWTVTDEAGEQVSFYTALPGGQGADIPLVRALTRALGWSLPDS